MSSPASPESGPPSRHHLFEKTAAAWPRLDLYERFEQAVSLVLSLVIGVVIVVALFDLVLVVGYALRSEVLAPLEQANFQSIFGMIMTVLIAMEFNHTILGIFQRRDSIVQVKAVILIALLAITRKFIVLDVSGLDPLKIGGLGFSVLALGAVYWLIREQDRRETATARDATTPK